MIAFGIVCGVRLRERYGGDHWVVASATAFGVAGAPFAHGHDLGFILPLAMMAFAVAPSLWTALVVILVMTPWQILADDGGIEAAIAYPFLLVAIVVLMRGRLLVTAAVLAAIFLVGSALLRLSNGNETPSAVASRLAALPTPPPDALATIRWTRLNDSLGFGPYAWYERAPVYAGFVLLALTTIRLARETGPAKA